MSEIDLSPHKIEPGETDYPEKHNAALDAVQDAVNEGLGDLDGAIDTLSQQITQELGEAVAQTDDAKEAAIEAAGRAEGHASSTDTDRAVVEAARSQVVAMKAATEAAAAEAEAIVVSGNVDLLPASGKIPMAGSNGKIHSGWVQGAGYPGNSIEAGTASTGIEIPDASEVEFTAQMTRVFDVFIPAELTEEIVLFKHGVTGIYITVDKRIRINCLGVYESDPVPASDNWIKLGVARLDNETDTTTVYFMVDGVQQGAIQVAMASDLRVASMLNDADGFYWCASPGHGSTLADGTVRLNRPGDPVGLQRDLSPNGLDMTQLTAPARPLLGRWPATAVAEGRVRNLLTLSEDFESSAWVKHSPVDGERLADGWYRLTKNTDESIMSFMSRNNIMAVDQPSIRTPWCVVKRGNTRYIVLTSKSGILNNESRTAIIDLETGEVTRSQIPTATTVFCEQLDDDIYILGYVNEAGPGSPSYEISFGIGVTGSSNSTMTGQVGDYVDVRYAQIDDGPARSAYQRVGAGPWDVTEVGWRDVWFHYYDHADDELSLVVPDIIGGTIILAGIHGIWIDELTVPAGTFRLGPDTYTGGPAGLLALVGGLIGGLVIGRPLSPMERDQWVQWFKGQGAPGVFELGGADNGYIPDFNQGTEGLYANNPSTEVSAVDGALRMLYTAPGVGSEYAMAERPISSRFNSYYRVRATVSSVSGNVAQRRISFGPYNANPGLGPRDKELNSDGSFDYIKLNRVGTAYLRIGHRDHAHGFESEWSAVSVETITLNTGVDNG